MSISNMITSPRTCTSSPAATLLAPSLAPSFNPRIRTLNHPTRMSVILLVITSPFIRIMVRRVQCHIPQTMVVCKILPVVKLIMLLMLHSGFSSNKIQSFASNRHINSNGNII